MSALVDDILQFCDVHRFGRVIFIGHSFAGAELTYITRIVPQCVTALIHIDATVNHAHLTAQLITVPLKPVPPVGAFASHTQLVAWLKQSTRFWSAAQDANVRASLITLPYGTVWFGLPRAIGEALFQGVQDIKHPFQVSMLPALGIFPVPIESHIISWQEWQQAKIALFQEFFPSATLVELPDAIITALSRIVIVSAPWSNVS